MIAELKFHKGRTLGSYGGTYLTAQFAKVFTPEIGRGHVVFLVERIVQLSSFFILHGLHTPIEMMALYTKFAWLSGGNNLFGFIKSGCIGPCL